MKIKSFMLLFVAATFLSLGSCKKEAGGGRPGGAGSIDSRLLGKWGWYSFDTRVFDEANNEYDTPPAFHYGRDDVQYDYKDNGTYYTTTDDGNFLPGKWYIKDGKLVQDGQTTYEYSFEDNNRTLILKNIVNFSENGSQYRREEYSVLSRDWLPE